MGKERPLKPRKEPLQQRSRQMVADILEAAARVLAEDGLAAFNTNRIAQVAGVSIGSLYQYFPNKASLLLRLQEQEAEQTWASLDAVLSDPSRAARDRLTEAVHLFFKSELDEVSLRNGLQQAEIYCNAVEGQPSLQTKVHQRLRVFLQEARAWDVDDVRGDSVGRGQGKANQAAATSEALESLQFEVELIVTMVSAIAARVTRHNPTPEQNSRWADACSDMLIQHLRL